MYAMDTTTFDAMDHEKLIEFVRKYKLLYDLSDKKYSDNHKKDQAWNEIGIKLKRNGKECKKAWALLRDAFRRSVKKRKDPRNGLDKRWKYEDEMSFLLPFMKERPSICPYPTIPAFDNDEDMRNIDEDALIAEEITIDVDQPATGTLLATSDICNQTAGTSSPDTLQTYPQPKRSKQGKKRTKETPSTLLMKYIIDSKNNTPPDDIGQFMAGITTTLRSFPARDRAIAKAKIFEIVSNMEIEILSRPSSTSESVREESPTLAYL